VRIPEGIPPACILGIGFAIAFTIEPIVEPARAVPPLFLPRSAKMIPMSGLLN
jgi:hypothetical protein